MQNTPVKSKLFSLVLIALLAIMLVPTLAFADDSACDSKKSAEEVLEQFKDSEPGEDYACDRIDVVFDKDKSSDEVMNATAEKYGCKLGSVHKNIHHADSTTAEFLLPDTMTAFEAVRVISEDENVCMATPMILGHFGVCDLIQYRGDNRYDTCLTLIKCGWADKGIEEAIVVCGTNWPDALVAASLAGTTEAPIMLTPVDELDTATEAALLRLAPRHVTVIGGDQAVSSAVFEDIETIVGGGQVDRICGIDRYATCEDVYFAGQDLWSHTAIVASGSLPYDALSASPYAFASKSPIVLCQPDGSISQAMLDDIANADITSVVIVGGTAAVPQTTQDMLANKLGAKNVIRLAGITRYETSFEFASWTAGNRSNLSVQPQTVFSFGQCAFATGEEFADALSAGPYFGLKHVVLLLTPNRTQNNPTIEALKPYKNKVFHGYTVGGVEALSNEVRRGIAGTLCLFLPTT